MGIQRCGLNLNRVNKELKPHGTLSFPCAAYCESYSDDPEHAIPWHWHEELEIAYIRRGSLILKVPQKTILLEEGDMVVINSNILHYAAAAPRCELLSLVFHSSVITGGADSVFAVKYLIPLTTQTGFNACLFKSGGSPAEADYFICAFEAMAGEAPGFEFTVRENLSKICCSLYLRLEPQAAQKENRESQDNLRVKRMLDFIHKHFAEPVCLPDIARAADIGEREALRCFNRTIQLSPIQYLLKYRIMQGADMLVKYPAKSVSETAALCGFDSLSNFSKIFRRFYNCTPKAYRKN